MVFRINESLSSNRAGPSNLCKLELASKNLQHPATVHTKGGCQFMDHSWTIHDDDYDDDDDESQLCFFW
jgi:hypothetical protein